MRVVQTIGVPRRRCRRRRRRRRGGGLKSRTIAATGRWRSRWRRCAGCGQGAPDLLQEYCSTFDSTPARQHRTRDRALMQALDCDFTIATPAFPTTGAPCSRGYLFVGDVLLSRAACANPLTPMTDANLVRVLQAQTRRRVGLIEQTRGDRQRRYPRPHRRPARRRGGHRHRRWRSPTTTCGAWPGAGGPAAGRLPAPAWRSRCRPISDWRRRTMVAALPAASGLGRWCRAVARRPPRPRWRSFIACGHPALALDPLRIAAGDAVVPGARLGAGAGWRGRRCWCIRPPTAGRREDHPAAPGRGEAGRAGGADPGGHRARGLVGLGVRQLVVAGGETSGACVQALGVAQLRIGAADRPRRAMVPRGIPAGAAGPAPRRSNRAISGRGFLHPGVRGAAGHEPAPMERARAATEIVRVGRSPVRAWLRACHGRQHQRAAGRRFT